jgi:hypothetical protein
MNIFKLSFVYDNKIWLPANNVVFKISVATLVVNSFCQHTTLKRLGAVGQILSQRCSNFYKTKGFPLNGNKPGIYLVINDLCTEFSKNRVGLFSDGLDGQVSIPGSARFFSSSKRPDRPLSPPKGYQGQSGRGIKLATHFHLVPRSRMAELCLHSRICLHGVVLN